MYECFHCCTQGVVWDSDFTFEDYGIEGEGLIHHCHCTNCGAEIEYYVPITEEDIDELKERFGEHEKPTDPTIPLFEESAEAYKAWTGEDMSKTEPSDLISRADAIEELGEYFDHLKRIDKRGIKRIEPISLDCKGIINKLPSAETTGALDDAISKYVADGYMLPPDGDLIRRADAIEAIRKQINFTKEKIKDGHDGEFEHGIIRGCQYSVMLIREIKELPSADRPSGEWIPLDGELPKIIGHHVLVTIKWADDELEVCEMCPTVADRYNIIAFQELPEPYQGEQIKSELQCSGALEALSNNITESPNDVVEKNDEVIGKKIIVHNKDWIIGCIKHDGYLHTDRFDKANNIIVDALESCDRPSGEWIEEYDDDGVVCSVCGKVHGNIWNYCPSCGAKMKGGAE